VLVVEPTDHNLTNWGVVTDDQTANAVLVQDLVRRIAPYFYARSKDGRNPLHPWTSFVRYLFPPARFANEHFYCYDIVFYSSMLFELSKKTIPYWMVSSRPGRYGAPAVGLLGGGTDVNLIPARPVAPLQVTEWNRLLRSTPQLPPLRPPSELATEWLASLGLEVNEPLPEDLPRDVDRQHILRIFIRLGTTTTDGAKSDPLHEWSNEYTKTLVQALTEPRTSAYTKTPVPPFVILDRRVVPVSGDSEAIWVWSLAHARTSHET
jgi:hypothetical protein